MKPKVFLTSDTHFLSSNIVDLCGRPKDFNRVLIKNWNSVVSPDDIVLHLGDYVAGTGTPETFKKIKIISAQLNGSRILIKGNHEGKSHDYYKNELWFTDVLIYLVIGEFFLCHYPLVVYPSDSESTVNKKKHLLSIFKKEHCRYVVHGHTHAQNGDLPLHFNVCTDLHDFTPLSFDFISDSLKNNS